MHNVDYVAGGEEELTGKAARKHQNVLSFAIV